MDKLAMFCSALLLTVLGLLLSGDSCSRILANIKPKLSAKEESQLPQSDYERRLERGRTTGVWEEGDYGNWILMDGVWRHRTQY